MPDAGGSRPPEARKVHVHFLPDDVTVEVNLGDTLLQAAQRADLYVNSICGGDGICGKCKVIVRQGDVHSAPTTLLSRNEIQQNYVLACQAHLHGDAEIEIPPESRLERGRILGDLDAERFGVVVPTARKEVRFPHDPLVKKFYLELKPPTMDDNLADHERLYQAIRRAEGITEMQTGFAVLRGLHATLRQADWKVTATVARRATTNELAQVEPGDTSQRNFGLAIDIGTTTVVVYLVSLMTGATIDSEAAYNSQMKHGDDYIRRIIYASEHHALDEMQSLIVGDINRLINILVQRTDVSQRDITCAICAGNTAMIHFLLGLDPAYIRREPYVPTANFIPPFRAAQVGIQINGRGILFLLPSVGAYVGSDITAGAVAVGLHQRDALTLFVDIGTNGEVLLGNREWGVCCSASAGPAFEGIGLRHGMRAARGAIEKFKMTDDFRPEYVTIGNRAPRGLCGSGLLDVLVSLFRVGLIDRSGTIQKDTACKKCVREGDRGLEVVLVEKKETAIGEDIVIAQPDIQNLLRSKAAIYAAISILAESLQVKLSDIQHVFLGGGFGNYLNVENAVALGMLPDIPTHRIEFAGNTSVAGANLALLSSKAFDEVEAIARRVTYFDLMGNVKFMDEFVSANFIPHTDLRRFPSAAPGGRNR